MKKLSLGYRSKIIFVIVGSIIGVASLLYSNYLASELASKEKNEMVLWAHAMEMKNQLDPMSQYESNVIIRVTKQTTNIPAIVTDEHLRVIEYHSVDERIIKNPKKLRRKLEKMSSGGHTPIEITGPYGSTLMVFYDDSFLLKSIYFFPYIQLSIIAIFIIFAFITFRSSKHNEQNRVWIGMAKETAHQLGTPISSLLGWIEYLRSLDLDPEALSEMGKDLARLMKVADRFGKIGSSTNLVERDVYEIVASTVDYFQTRIPRNVTLSIERCDQTPLRAKINDALFEWVIENLLKNALDALQGKGSIRVVLFRRDRWVIVDVKDTGKGMAKSNFKSVFRPGFTTKTRGWGLGLSLSRRIVEEYHYGRIFVRESEIGKGTTFRIQLLASHE